MKIIKQALLFGATLGLSALTFGQIQKPEAGRVGATAGLSAIAGNLTTDASTTGSLLLRYYVTDRIVARGAFNVQTVSNSGTTVTGTTEFTIPFNQSSQGFPASGDGETTLINEISGMLYNLEFGGQYNIADIENMEVFLGASVIFGLDGNRKTYYRRDWIIEGSDRSVGDFDESTLITPVRTRIGGRFMLGANYFITENIAIGAEFGYAFHNVVRNGGEVTTVSKENGTQSEPTIIDLSGFSETRNQLGTTGAILTLSFFL